MKNLKTRVFPFTLLLFGAVALLVSAAPQTRPAQPPAPSQPATKPDADPDAQAKLQYVLMSTSMGDIVIELNREKAPISVANFLNYTDKKFYDGTIFHRVMGKENTPNKKDFMIQGGGFTPDMAQKKTDAPIKNEWQNGLKNTRGTIAMARLGDRQPNPSRVDSATAQFFINVGDNPDLDQPQPDGGAYAVFGKVVAGMKTVDAIKAVPTTSKLSPETNRPLANVPVEPVIIKSVTRLTPDQAKERIDAQESASQSQ